MAAGDKILPAVVPFPTRAVRLQIPLDLWETCVESWRSLTQAYILLSQDAFAEAIASSNNPVIFLSTFAQEAATASKSSKDLHLEQSLSLQHNVLVLAHRCLVTLPQPPAELGQWRFAANICTAFQGSHLLQEALPLAWERHEESFERSLQQFKTVAAKNLETRNNDPADLEATKRLAHLIRCVPAAGRFLLTGSDFIDSVAASYAALGVHVKASLVVVVFLSFKSLLQEAGARPPLAFDLLYGLATTAQAGQSQRQTLEPFVQDLVSKTPLLKILRSMTTASDVTRAKDLAQRLSTFYHTGRTRRRVRPTKQRSNRTSNHKGINDAHVHTMARITQVQDVFPDLGTSFIAKLLDEYGDNVELVTSHLLEDDLPSHLRSLDRAAKLSGSPPSNRLTTLEKDPSSPKRRNVFDDDDFDKLAADTSRIHLGRKDETSTADQLLDTGGDLRSSNKAAVLSALAAFDADDDERDDTYDLADVGGTVDSIRPDGMEETKAANEEAQRGFEQALFSAWQRSSQVFARDAKTRRSEPRAALKRETGMTDEAIEGWAIMLQRDARKLRSLEARYSTFSGHQQALQGSSWRASDQGAGESEEDDASNRGPQHQQGRGGHRGRGRGRGNVAGSSNERSTQVARDRKETGKGSRANHNRRNQRARKVARAGFAE